MTYNKQEYFVLKYQDDDSYVFVDNSSGGYPSKVSSLTNATIFTNIEQVNKYYCMFRELNIYRLHTHEEKMV